MKRYNIEEPEVDDIVFLEVGQSDVEKLNARLESCAKAASHHSYHKRRYKQALEVLLHDLIFLSDPQAQRFGDFTEMNTNVHGMKIEQGLLALVERAKKDLKTP